MIKYEVQGGFDRTAGSHLQGHIGATYRMLVDLFGLPLRGDGDKTQVEWVVEFYDADEDCYQTATIYDWKQYDKRPEHVLEWNVGGFNPVVVDLLEQAMREHSEKKYALLLARESGYRIGDPYDRSEVLTPDDLNRRFADSVGMSVRWEG